MADSKISAMPIAVTVNAPDLVPIVQGGVNKTATVSQFNSASIFSGSGAPTIQIPTGTAGIYYDYTNQTFYGWNPITLSWQ